MSTSCHCVNYLPYHFFMAVTETLRDHLKVSEETLYRVAKDIDVRWATLKRFVEGGGLRSEQIDKLAAYFNLELTPAAAKSVKKPTKRKK